MCQKKKLLLSDTNRNSCFAYDCLKNSDLNSYIAEFVKPEHQRMRGYFVNYRSLNYYYFSKLLIL